MGLEAAAEQLRMMEAVHQRQEDERKRKSQQEDIIYHQWATFRVDNERYGIDVMRVKEVLRYSDITPVPGSDHSILGILNLRGNFVTVIDTRTLFHLSRVEAEDATRVVVVELNEHDVIGLVVHSVDEVINLPQNEVDRAPSAVNEESTRRFVQGVCYHNKVLIILLDLGKMLVSITPDLDD